MILNTIICDDDNTAISTLEYYLQKYSIQQVGIDFNTRTFLSAEDFLPCLEKAVHDFAVIFLDIEMNKMDGITLAEEIRKNYSSDLKLIFVSSYPKYMQHSFRVQPFQFLTKPVSYSDFESVMDAVLHNIRKSKKTLSILPLLNDDNGKLIIRLDDIVSIETIPEKRRRILITLSDGKEWEAHGIIGDWEKDLSEENFLSPSRGVLINIAHIRYITKDKIFLTAGKEVSISRRRQKEIHEIFSRNILKVH